MSSSRTQRRLLVTGRVQGVGFRPHVVRTAVALGVHGWVRNDGDGVTIVAAALPAVLDRFERVLRATLPAPGRIDRVTTLAVDADEPLPADGFRIVASAAAVHVTQECAPDFAPCADCLAEMAGDGRRAGYAHIACSACGPRHAITAALPFDRPATTMAAFPLCAACAREYADPADRRFHAQLISCPDCGPRLAFSDMQGGALAPAADALAACVRTIAAGGIVAVQGVGGFLLVCDATRAEVVATLRARKRRPMKPLAVLMRDLAVVARYCAVQPDEAAALASSAAPIVILRALEGVRLPMAQLAPELDALGVMLPASPLLVLLARALPVPLVATSANVSGSPTLHRADDVRRLLADVADACLADDRQILVPQDDSVLRFTPVTRSRIVLRCGRGLAPAPADAPFVAAAEATLAVGAHMKGAFVLGGEGVAWHSQYLGDLESAESEASYGRVLAHARRVTGLVPRHVVCDAHPGYATTRLAHAVARESGATLRTVWHHRAHLLALLAEHGRAGAPEPVLGVVWDGTGLGEDGTLWGGEWLLAEGGAIARVAHLAPVPMPFGDRMAREPRLSLAAYGAQSALIEARAATRFDVDEWARVRTARRLAAGQRGRTTSSMGRLFDAAAALLGLGTHASYEGCAALRLEALAQRAPASTAPWPGELAARDAHGAIHGVALLERIAHDLDAGDARETIAWRFHDALAALAWEIAAALGVRTMGITGGCWQNALLVDRVLARTPTGARVLAHRQLPPNDENVAFGQFVAVALDARRPLAAPAGAATVPS